MRSPLPPTTHKIKRWLFVILTIYLLAALILLTSVNSMTTVAKNVPATALAIFMGTVSVAFALRCGRWCLLARRAAPTVRHRDLLRVYIGGFPMVLTPGRVGEIWRAWVMASHWNVRYRRGLSLVIADRLLDLTALLLFIGLGVFSDGVFQYPAVMALVTLMPLLLLAVNPHWGIFVIKMSWAATGKWRPRLAAFLVAVCRRVAAIFHSFLFVPAVLLSLLAWGMEAFAIYIFIGALNGTLSFDAAMITLGLSNIAGILTLTPAGIGGQEAAMTYLLHGNGNTMGISVTTTVVAKIGTVFYGALLGFPFFLKLSRR